MLAPERPLGCCVRPQPRRVEISVGRCPPATAQGGEKTTVEGHIVASSRLDAGTRRERRRQSHFACGTASQHTCSGSGSVGVEARQRSVNPSLALRPAEKSSTRMASRPASRPSTMSTGRLSRRKTESPACGTSIVIFRSPAVLRRSRTPCCGRAMWWLRSRRSSALARSVIWTIGVRPLRLWARASSVPPARRLPAPRRGPP